MGKLTAGPVSICGNDDVLKSNIDNFVESTKLIFRRTLLDFLEEIKRIFNSI